MIRGRHNGPSAATEARLLLPSLCPPLLAAATEARLLLPSLRPRSNVLLSWRDRRPTAKVVGYGLTGRKVGRMLLI